MNKVRYAVKVTSILNFKTFEFRRKIEQTYKQDE